MLFQEVQAVDKPSAFQHQGQHDVDLHRLTTGRKRGAFDAGGAQGTGVSDKVKFEKIDQIRYIYIYNQLLGGFVFYFCLLSGVLRTKVMTLWSESGYIGGVCDAK